MLCGQRTLLGEAGGHGVAASLQCRCWSCPDCEPRNRAKLTSLIVELDPTFFVTLTVNPHWLDSPAARARRLSAAWSTCRRRLRRQTGQALDFTAVFEATARGEPHLHVALRASLLPAKVLQRWLSCWMSDLIGAPYVEVAPVTDLSRLARYMSKAPVLFVGTRRYWTSRGWRVAKWAADAVFALLSIARAPLAIVERAAVAAGHVITDRSPLRFTTQLPFAPP